jgi:hypothetical protein
MELLVRVEQDDMPDQAEGEEAPFALLTPTSELVPND